MRVAIASDIHGNNQAFEAVIAAAEADGADELWCLGDLVGYGAEPDACVALAERPLHDLPGRQPRSRGRRRALARGLLARRGARRLLDARGDHARRRASTCSSLSPKGRPRGYGLFHASPRDPVWEYVLSALAAELCFDATDFRISFIGHSHVALSFHRPEGEPATGTTRRDGVEVDLARAASGCSTRAARAAARRRPARRLARAGHRAWTATWRRAEYDIAGAQAAIRAANLPDSLAERLQYGQ